jgi:competence protein ComEA
VNQADYIYDGQKIIILKVGENRDSIQGLTKGPINLNTANKEQLSTLNGIGEKTADKIINYRQKNGPFSTVEDLMKVSGIGASKLDGIRGEVVVN